MKKNVLILVAAFCAASFLLIAAFVGYNYFYLDKVTGKVIIVQKNAFANKMPLVKVVAIARKDAIAWRESIMAQCRLVFDERQRLEAASKVEIDIINTRHDQLIGQGEAYLEKSNELSQIAHRIWLVDSSDKNAKTRFFLVVAESRSIKLKQLEDFAISGEWQIVYKTLKEKLIPDAEAALGEARKNKTDENIAFQESYKNKQRELTMQFLRIVSAENLARLPAWVRVVSSDRTDDTGEYVLRVPRGDYYVVASAERSVFSDIELYHWAQPVSVPSKESSKCLLGNMNLVGSGENDLWQDLFSQLSMMRESK